MAHDDCPPAQLPAFSITWGDAPMIAHSTWLGEGDFCTCYLVNGVDVFRFAKHAAASAAMQIERCLLPVLNAHLAIDVPVLHLAGHNAHTGQSLLGYRLVPGEPLERAALEALPNATQATLLAQLAGVVRQLHALPIQLVGQCGLPTLQPLAHLPGVMQRAQTVLQPHMSASAWHYHEQLLAWYLRQQDWQQFQPALLHGDLSPDHVLADLQQMCLTGVIDFGDACLGDPAWDLIYLYEDLGTEMFAVFLAHYDAENASVIGPKVRLYQQFNNIEYGLRMLANGDDTEFCEALAILEQQARS